MQPDQGIERLLKELENRTVLINEILEKFYKVDEILGGDILISGRNFRHLRIFIIWKYKKKEKFMNILNKFLKDNIRYDEVKKQKVFYEFHWERKRHLHKVEITGVRNPSRYEYSGLSFKDTLEVLTILEQFTINPIEN
jgi:hypothetical protein